MALIIQKFGGTSVGTTDRILNVAKRVAETCQAGHQVIVVVSAMAGETNRLIDLARQIHDVPTGRELDQLVSTGEQVAAALTSLALQKIGQKSRSFTAAQIQILTDTSHTKARIRKIDATALQASLARGEVPVVTGFQGVTESGDLTTLGRGGSDTTAVALAAALNADLCEIYTDVDGVYTTDPRICSDAQKLAKISYEEMLELSSAGAKVLQIRSVEFAAKYKVNLVVRSSFSNEPGTLVADEDKIMEDILVSGVTLTESEAKVSIRDLPDKPGVSMRIFGPIADADINVDMIIQNTGTNRQTTDLSFTVPVEDLHQAKRVIENLSPVLGFSRIDADSDVAKVSIVGVGMRSHAGVAAKAFKALADAGINIDMISTSEIKISIVVRKDAGKAAVKALHDAFELGKPRS